MRKLNRGYGFTLIELAITLTVIGILSLITAFAWPNTTRWYLTLQTQQLANDLRYMQNYAATRHNALRINFSSSQYSFTELDGTTAIKNPATSASAVTLSTGITLSTTNLPSTYVVFDSNGIPYTNTSLAANTALAVSAAIILAKTGVTGTTSISPQSGAISKPVIS